MKKYRVRVMAEMSSWDETFIHVDAANKASAEKKALALAKANECAWESIVETFSSTGKYEVWPDDIHDITGEED